MMEMFARMIIAIIPMDVLLTTSAMTTTFAHPTHAMFLGIVSIPLSYVMTEFPARMMLVTIITDASAVPHVMILMIAQQTPVTAPECVSIPL
jgi:hypothetical protein